MHKGAVLLDFSAWFGEGYLNPSQTARSDKSVI